MHGRRPAQPAITTQASDRLGRRVATDDGDGHRARQPGHGGRGVGDGRVPALRPERRDVRDGDLHVVEPSADVQTRRHARRRRRRRRSRRRPRARTAGARSTAATPTTTRSAVRATRPNESGIVRPATPAISTQASTASARAGTLGDTATVTGLVNPITGAERRDGRVPALRGPKSDVRDGDLSRRDAAADVQAAPATAATASAPFTPTAAGTYRWRAFYSGDANNAAVTGACNAANESASSRRRTPAITTQASAGRSAGRSEIRRRSRGWQPGHRAGAATVSSGSTAAERRDVRDGDRVHVANRPLTFTGGPPATGGDRVGDVTRRRPRGPITGGRSSAATPTTRPSRVPATRPTRRRRRSGARRRSTRRPPTALVGWDDRRYGATVTGLVNPVTSGAGAGTVTFRLYSDDARARRCSCRPTGR